VPFNALGPMNYTQAALSNTGAYQVVAAANGGVYTSANSGSTWSQALTSPQVAASVNTVGGQLITPQLTGLAAATWTQNGVNWMSSVSSQLGGTPFSYYAFQNTNDGNIWISAGNYSSGVYNNTFSTTVLGIGAVFGEWLQIQSSVPLVITSYTFQVFNFVYFPKSYYIVGSSDGTTWYPVQSCVLATNPNTANNVKCSNDLLVNFNGTQTLTGNVSSAVTTTSYTTTTTPYTYFRIIVTGLFSTGIYAEIGEWYVNFATPPTPLYVAPSTALIANQSLSAITVMPQQRGLIGAATARWTTNGISWVASASSAADSTYYAYMAFDNFGGSGNGWVTGTTNYTTTPLSSGTSTTVLDGIGTVFGEWIQIQSSVPLVMSTYQLAFGGTPLTLLPRSFYIVGSVDGTNWYPLQSAVGAAVPGLNPFVLVDVPTIVNSTGTQIWGTSTLATMAYSTSTNAYTYFRMIVTSTFTTSTASNAVIGEWAINFTAYTPALLQSLAMSPTGTHMALTGADAVAPQLTGLTGGTGSSPVTTGWTANGVAWTSSASTAAGFNLQPWVAFNNFAATTTSPPSYSWASIGYAIGVSGYNPSGVYQGSASTTVLLSVGAVTGEWLQIQSSVPLVMSSYTFACGDFRNYPNNYFIVGSTDGTNWFPIQSVTTNTNPFTVGFTAASTYLTVSQAGTQLIQGNVSGSATCLVYNTTGNAFTYFRLIARSTFGGPNGNFELTEWYINFQSGPTFYSTDYGSSWTRALSAATLPNANVLATSGGGQYSLQASGQLVTVVSNIFAGYSTGNYTTPTFTPALSSAVSNAAVSATGQYMVLVTQGTTNNVYYSMNYGVSFTGITLGSAAMVSCAISADGSYITVSSATQVFTLNRNAQGFAVTIGSQAGLINQGQNVIAIGNQAGVTNQSAGSIILNTSGSVVNSYVPGFFVAPVASAGSSIAPYFSVLGYGSDSQVVQSSSLFIGANGNVGIGRTNPQAAFHVQGETLFTNPTVYNTAVAGWYIIGYWDCSAAQSVGAHLKLRITGCNGYDNSADSNQMGGETTIYLNNLNNFNTTTFANMDGFWKSEGGRPVITQAKAVQGGSRYQYYIYANVQSYTQHSITAETTQGTIWTSQFTFTTDPGANSLTVRVLTLSTVAVGTNVGIGTTTPIGQFSVALDGLGIYNPGFWTGSYALFGPGAGATNGSAVAITYNTTSLYGSLICLTAAVAWRDMYYSANQHVFYTAGSATERMRINTAGFVGIGTNPGYLLHLSTDSAAKPSTNTWTISSDERLKENIILADIDRCVEIIRAVPLKHYRWKDEVYTLEQVKDRSKLGWIAQDVEKIFPKAVNSNPFRYNQVYEDVVKEDGTTEKRLVSEDVIEDCRDLNADQLYAVMYGAIQKLISENDLYKTTNIAINEQFAALQARMDALEARLAS